MLLMISIKRMCDNKDIDTIDLRAVQLERENEKGASNKNVMHVSCDQECLHLFFNHT